MTEEEKEFAGLMYSPADPALVAVKRRAHILSVQYSMTTEDETEKREKIIHELFPEIGEGSRLQGPISIHYGTHTKIGKNFFANFNLTIQDDTKVTIGDDCDFGPNVTIVTPVHPLVAEERMQMRKEDGTLGRLCCGKQVHIGNRVWLGASVTICPGVTIGDDCVIGAGSVVTHDIPAGSLAYGVPCRVARKITKEKDSMKNKPEILGGASVI